MLPRIWLSGVPKISPTWTLQPFRFFSLSCYKNQANSDQDPNAPITFRTKLKEYPELYKMSLACRGAINKELWAKIRAEPELLRVVQEESRRNHKRLLTTNPHFRAKVSARVKAYFHAHKHEEAYVRGKSISRWCFCMPDKSKSAWVRENLPWKTHLPHHQSERSYHFYSCCGISRYMKTGWQSKTDPDEFLCHRHYVERGWDAAMAEGYEDVRTYKEIQARYKKLNPGSSSKP